MPWNITMQEVLIHETETGNLGASKRAGQCDGTYDYIFIKS